MAGARRAIELLFRNVPIGRRIRYGCNHARHGVCVIFRGPVHATAHWSRPALSEVAGGSGWRIGRGSGPDLGCAQASVGGFAIAARRAINADERVVRAWSKSHGRRTRSERTYFEGSQRRRRHATLEPTEE